VNNVRVSTHLPQNVAEGFEKGVYERVGGLIREIDTGRIIAFLREAYGLSEPVLSELLALPSSAANANALNLALSTMQFALLMKRLEVIETELRQAQQLLSKINYKFDLSFYANFQAALNLASNALTMSSAETRRVSSMQAINRFLVAEHHYTDLVDIEIANQSQIADDYLATLCLAYITEVRCYLELNELDVALHRLREGVSALRPRYEQHVRTLLTSNPSAYLHPSLKGQIDLARLARIYLWLAPEMDDNAVFEAQRENLFTLAKRPEDWMASLPPAIQLPVKSSLLSAKSISEAAARFADMVNAVPTLAAGRLTTLWRDRARPSSEPAFDVFARLAEATLLIESMIEQCSRFEAYVAELEAVKMAGMTFEDWRQLAPADAQPQTGLLYVLLPPAPGVVGAHKDTRH
jgi:hypothetical protein